jgi:hypothetical protein
MGNPSWAKPRSTTQDEIDHLKLRVDYLEKRFAMSDAAPVKHTDIACMKHIIDPSRKDYAQLCARVNGHKGECQSAFILALLHEDLAKKYWGMHQDEEYANMEIQFAKNKTKKAHEVNCSCKLCRDRINDGNP